LRKKLSLQSKGLCDGKTPPLEGLGEALKHKQPVLPANLFGGTHVADVVGKGQSSITLQNICLLVGDLVWPVER
jgi:hypothetical protein